MTQDELVAKVAHYMDLYVASLMQQRARFPDQQAISLRQDWATAIVNLVQSSEEVPASA